MGSQAIRSIVWGQACLYTGLVVAILIKPSGLASNDGISYFGTFARTVVPYTLGLLGSAYLCLIASKYIDSPEFRPLKDSLVAIALLMVFIVATPYSVKPLLDWIHTAAGTALFCLQLLLSGWLAYKLHYNIAIVVLAIIELAAGIACAIYLLPNHGLLMQCQIIFQVAFGILLIYSLHLLSRGTAPQH
jgi:hypothetical protein